MKTRSASSTFGVHFGFHWQTSEEERQEIFSAGWDTGVYDDEVFNHSRHGEQ
jgi:hypothetical protein